MDHNTLLLIRWPVKNQSIAVGEFGDAWSDRYEVKQYVKVFHSRNPRDNRDI